MKTKQPKPKNTPNSSLRLLHPSIASLRCFVIYYVYSYPESIFLIHLKNILHNSSILNYFSVKIQNLDFFVIHIKGIDWQKVLKVLRQFLRCLVLFIYSIVVNRRVLILPLGYKLELFPGKIEKELLVQLSPISIGKWILCVMSALYLDFFACIYLNSFILEKKFF